MFESLIEKTLGIKIGSKAKKYSKKNLKKRIMVEMGENSIKLQTENYFFETSVVLDKLIFAAEEIRKETH